MEQYWRPISEIHAFPTYNSRKDFKNKTGKEWDGTFDPQKPVKTWADLDATKKTFPPTITYDVVMIDPHTNLPVFVQYSMRRSEAASLNIPHDEAGGNESVAFEKEIPVPVDLSKIRAGEVLGDDPSIGVTVVLIDTKKQIEQSHKVEGFTLADRALLFEIARSLKLNV